MRRSGAITAALATAALAGCAPVGIWYQTGADVTRVQRDALACEVAALGQAPVAMQRRVTPVVVMPPRRVCDKAGNCVVRPGGIRGGEVIERDVNAPLRQRIEAQCMADKGYSYQRLPRCSQSVAARAPAGATRVLPRLTESSCAIPLSGGGYRIVNRG